MSSSLIKRERLVPTQSGSWSALSGHSDTAKLSCKEDPSLEIATDRRQAGPRECLDGIIDNALAAFQVGNTHCANRGSRALSAFTPTHIPKDLQEVSFSNGPPARSSSFPAPLLLTSYNAFENVPTSAVSQQSSHLSIEKDPFSRMGAEIDEILSPVSDCASKNSGALQVIQGMSSPAPMLVRDEVNDGDVEGCRNVAATYVKGTAMQDVMKAVAKPAKARRGTRRSQSSSTQCHLCGKVYTESSNLSKHIRTVHLRLRPFQCHKCSSSFAEKNKLGKHVQSVHEHARPYKCELCSATFSQASDRKRHRLVLHEGCRPFSCEECGKAFGRRSSLTQHCHRVHKRSKQQVVGQLDASKRNK